MGGREGGHTLLGEADRFRVHNFVGGFVLEHPVLVNAAFVGKGVGADDGLVWLDYLREGGREGEVNDCTFVLCISLYFPPSLLTMPVKVDTKREVFQISVI